MFYLQAVIEFSFGFQISLQKRKNGSSVGQVEGQKKQNLGVCLFSSVCSTELLSNHRLVTTCNMAGEQRPRFEFDPWPLKCKIQETVTIMLCILY